jgi:hypothetical protein
MAALYRWKVAAAPTGLSRVATKRQWPTAFYTNGGDSAAQISCTDGYYPSDVKRGTHAPLTVRVADHSVTPHGWRKIKGEFATLDAAKAAVAAILTKYPHFQPKKGS